MRHTRHDRRTLRKRLFRTSTDMALPTSSLPEDSEVPEGKLKLFGIPWSLISSRKVVTIFLLDQYTPHPSPGLGTVVPVFRGTSEIEWT